MKDYTTKTQHVFTACWILHGRPAGGNRTLECDARRRLDPLRPALVHEDGSFPVPRVRLEHRPHLAVLPPPLRAFRSPVAARALAAAVASQYLLIRTDVT
eukprot:COSAG01_NODE_20748_length_937_cov_1.458234_1_plen_100_part_00